MNADLLDCVICSLGSHRVFSTGSSDQCIFIKHALWKTIREDWNEGNSMSQITITIITLISEIKWLAILDFEFLIFFSAMFSQGAEEPNLNLCERIIHSI